MAADTHDSWYPPAAAATPMPADGAAVDLAARIARLPAPVREVLARLVAEVERGLLRGAPPAGTA